MITQENRPKKARFGRAAGKPRNETRQPLNEEVASRLYYELSGSDRSHQLRGLKEEWTRNRTLSDFVKDARLKIEDSALDDPKLASEHIAKFVESIVEDFEFFVETGQLDSVLPRLTALPTLYTTKASKGASKWESAKHTFEDKSVGSKSLCAHRGIDSQTTRNPNWGRLAQAAVRIAWNASQNYAKFQTLKLSAIDSHPLSWTRPYAKKALTRTLFLLGNQTILLWPDWLDLCEELPDRVKKDPDAYKRASRPIIEEFFADPSNPAADQILEPMLTSRTRSYAALQARKSIIDAIGRL
jgi:hypothetical protein